VSGRFRVIQRRDDDDDDRDDDRGAVTLENGRPERDLSDDGGRERLYRIYVPRGTARLRISASGGRGQYDLLVSHGRRPTGPNSVSTASRDRGIDIDLRSPRQGWWYVVLRARRSYRGVDLVARYGR